MIVFENEGLMPLEAFTTFGVNAKPNTDNPIGHFGTGLKYAVAVTLRLGGRFQLFIGHTEYEFYVKSSDFRGKEFDMIRMRKRKRIPVIGRWQYDKLPFTTELGKNWEPWMAVRELESNTRDENGDSYEVAYLTEKADGSLCDEGHTMIVIDCPEMEAAYHNLDQIFMPDKKLIAEVGSLKIYEGQSNYIFYRGLRVTDLDKPSLFTYEFDLGVTLTEDRTSKWPYCDMNRIMEAIMSLTNQDMLDMVMDADEDEWYEGDLPWDQPYVQPGTNFYASLCYRVATGGIVPKRMKSYYESINKEDDPDPFIEVMLRTSHIEELIQLTGDLADDENCYGEICDSLKKATK